MEAEITTTSVEETIALGMTIGRALPKAARVFLSGEMGSGKTHLTKGLYLGTGGTDADDVTSPTYAMVNVYGEGPRAFIHADLFRLPRPELLETLDVHDFLLAHPGPTVIEWPEAAGERLEGIARLDILIRPGAREGERRFTLCSGSDEYRDVFCALGRC